MNNEKTSEDENTETNAMPTGIHINDAQEDLVNTMKNEPECEDDWCYLFTHNKVVTPLAQALTQKGFRCFVHRTVVYEHKKDSHGIKEMEKATVSGMMFIQGDPTIVQAAITKLNPGRYLMKDCATKKPATIPHKEMVPFMRVMETDPARIKVLLKPLEQYAKNNARLRIKGGMLDGLEGYIIRFHRSRCLVMKLGVYIVAITDIHKEMFELVQ